VQLPTVYTAAIHRDLIDEAKRRTGRIFRGRYPDVYSGFAFGYLSGRYPSIGVPMSIGAVSGSSTGIANLFRRGESPLDEDFRQLNDEARLPSHPWIPDLPIFPEVPVADSFELAREALFPDRAALVIDRQRLFAHCVAGVRPSNQEEDLAAIRACTRGDHELEAWLDATLRANTIAPRPPIRLRPERFGFYGGVLHLDTERFGVKNIQGAVRLAEDILRFRDREIDYELAGAAPSQETRA
jgi:hypothetical protein